MPSNPCFQHLLPCQLTCSRGIASKLFIKGLSLHTTKEALSEAFSKYGQVVEAKIIMDRVSDRSRGFGFVTFASLEEAKNAISEMNGKVLDGRAVFVDNANSVRTGILRYKHLTRCMRTGYLANGISEKLFRSVQSRFPGDVLS